jgi:F-type H+-transporting ATPase subunit h
LSRVIDIRNLIFPQSSKDKQATPAADASTPIKRPNTNEPSSTADFVQELYLKELKAYKAPAVKESDSVGQVQVFNLPTAPKSPEEADLASNLKEYESMAVELEGQDATQATQGSVAQIPDWLEAEEDEAEAH